MHNPPSPPLILQLRSGQALRGGIFKRFLKIVFVLFLGSLFFLFIKEVGASQMNGESYTAFKMIQSHREINIVPGKGFTFTVGFKNTGRETWYRDGRNYISLYIKSKDEQKYRHKFWHSPEQPARLETPVVKPGEIGYLKFALEAPKEVGAYPAHFRLAAEDKAWARGGELDIVLNVKEKIEVLNPKQVQNSTHSTSSGQDFKIQNSQIRVSLFTATEPVQITADGSYEVRDKNNNLLFDVVAKTVSESSFENLDYTLKISNLTRQYSSYLKSIPKDKNTTFEIINYENRPEWNPALNDNLFKGSLEIRYNEQSPPKADPSPAGKKLWVINELELEDYLEGIAEVPNNKPTEYTKAMAVAARTYAVYHLNKGGKHQGEPFHLKNSQKGNGDDQIYKGYGFTKRALTSGGYNFVEAVRATKGEIILYNNQPIIAAYSSDSGGIARDARAVWGEKYQAHPYLWGIDANGQPTTDPADTIRRSQAEQKASHGVGLSGAGAEQMARNGKTYQEILKYYYPGAGLGKLGF